MSWFDPVPLEQFEEINRSESQRKVPEECPKPAVYGSMEVHCGPILRLCGSWENSTPNYRGSILLVVKGAENTPEISYSIGPAAPVDGFTGPSGGGFPATRFFLSTDDFHFWRFDIRLSLAEVEQRVRYSINGSANPEHAFFIPAAEQSMNVVSYSCNGFSLATDTTKFSSSLWLDVLRKHKTNHYHVMLGGGDQIYNDAVKLHSPLLSEWLSQANSSKKRSDPATDELLRQMESFYLHAYMQWFGFGYWKGTNGATCQSLLPLSMAQIPSVNIYDDHDIIDGFGSYPDRTMRQPVFASVGNVAYKYYMLFQHHMLLDEPCYTEDPLWILLKSKGPYINQLSHSVYMRLGKEISLLGLDCRTERKLDQVVDPDTYDRVFARCQEELDRAPETKHLLVMLGVPILYPRLVWLEWIFSLPLLKPIRGLAERGVINKGLVNEFDGGVEVLDDLNDHWCSKHHKRERNLILKRLTELGASNSVRITILSGDVHLGCFGRLKTKLHNHPHAHLLTDVEQKNKDVTEHPERDPRLIFNVISSAIVNAPPPDAMASLLNKRSKIHHYDKFTTEDVIPIFTSEPDGKPRSNHQFLNKRNWSDLILAKNSSVYASQTNQGISKFPCALFDHDIKALENKTVSQRYTKYPLYDESLVATLYVEADGTDPKARTGGYEVVIPELRGKFELEQTTIKHLEKMFK